MSKSVPMSQKKRKLEDGMRGKTQKPRKRMKKQKAYHSSSEDDDEPESGFAPVSLDDSEEEVPARNPASGKQAGSTSRPSAEQDIAENDSEATGEEDEEDEEDEENENNEDEDDSSSQLGDKPTKRKTSKRNDPEAFSTSISKILSTKLSQSARKDPLLSRSKEAVEASSTIANERLENRAKAKIRAEKKEELERGRIKDVVGVSTGESGKVAEEEKRLRKIAQRGVVKLFNAVRAAQVRGEQAAREERKKGSVGMANREEKATEMSKQGFLELISGKPKESMGVGEA